MAIYALGDDEPQVHPDAFVHPEAVLIGAVIVGADASIWPGAVLRADDGPITIGERTSVQDNSVIHTCRESPTWVGDDVTLGHMVHLEGCIIHNRTLIGVGAIVLQRAVVHSGAIVAANAAVLDDMVVPAGALAVGTPAKMKLGLARAEVIEAGPNHYVARVPEYKAQMRRIDP